MIRFKTSANISKERILIAEWKLGIKKKVLRGIISGLEESLRASKADLKLAIMKIDLELYNLQLKKDNEHANTGSISGKTNQTIPKK